MKITDIPKDEEIKFCIDWSIDDKYVWYFTGIKFDGYISKFGEVRTHSISMRQSDFHFKKDIESKTYREVIQRIKKFFKIIKIEPGSAMHKYICGKKL